MKVTVTLEFLNVEQLNLILDEKINGYNKHRESNIIYVENSRYNFLHRDHSKDNDKIELMKYIEKVCDDYHYMAMHILNAMNNVIVSNIKHKNVRNLK